MAGPNGWQDIARSMGIDDVLLIDATGRAHMTKTLAGLVHFEQPPTGMETVTLEARERH